MRSVRAACLGFCAALMAASAGAQQAPADPIGDLLNRPGQPTPEMEEPDTASQLPGALEPEPDLVPLPTSPQPYMPQVVRPRLTAPVNINELGKSPEAPPTMGDLAYESRIRASFASTQGFQGPLDGGWTLAAQDGADLYALVLIDRGGGLVEGAWRDLRRPGAIGASGFVDPAQSVGAELTLRFNTSGAAAATATLRGGYDGRWTGELQEAGARRTVTLRRKN